MKTKTKKIVIGSTCTALIAAISVGGTLAYLTTETTPKTNNFTFASDALTAVLTEPDWDGIIDYVDIDGTVTPIYGYDEGEDGNLEPITTKPTVDADGENIVYGEDVAKNMVPGTVVAKDPTITNTCDLSEYVAVKVRFVYSSGENSGKPLEGTDLTTVMDVITVDYDADKDTGAVWERKADEDKDDASQTFYYKTEVAGGGSTEPLFNTVTVNEDATSEQINALNEMGGFQIVVEGYAAQADTVEYDTFKTDVTFGSDTTTTN